MSKARTASLGIFLLLAVSAGAKPAPIGTVSSCTAATIHGASLVPGSTIFSGDEIDVGPGGSAWIAAPGGTQVQVFENSAVSFTSNEKSIEVTVTRGLVRTNSANIVVRTLPSVVGLQPHSAPAVHSQRHDCVVSKSTTRSTPCHDDSD
jgi:hypothetical protein